MWSYFGKTLDPSHGGRLSHELKDLINRMFDVDPRRRMSIEEVCAHPWLQSHQARGPAVPPASVETEEQRATYMAEMSRRFHTHIESKCVLNLIIFNTGLRISLPNCTRCSVLPWLFWVSRWFWFAPLLWELCGCP